MSKLLERLSDPKKSGVYCIAHDRDVRDALSGAACDLATVALVPGKPGTLAAIAGALDFPEWFGANWDALEDCLTDLSWRKGAPRVFLFSGATPGDDFGILRDVLESAAEYWGGRGEAFFAVFVDPGAALSLPVLYKEKVRGPGA
jgi:hypothetical protein